MSTPLHGKATLPSASTQASDQCACLLLFAPGASRRTG